MIGFIVRGLGTGLGLAFMVSDMVYIGAVLIL